MATTTRKRTTIKKADTTPKTQTSAPVDPNYIRIPLPNVKLFSNLKGSNPALLLLVLFFGIVSVFLFLKIQSLENNLANSPARTAPEAFVRYAKKLGLDTNKFSTCLTNGKYAAQVQEDLTEGNRVGVSGTPTMFINGEMVVGARPYESFKAVIDKYLAQATLGTSSPLANALGSLVPQAYAQTAPTDPEAVLGGNAQNTDAIPTPTPVIRTDISAGRLPILGNKNAKVTIVEYSDFQCPYCEQFFTSTLGQIKKDYIDTGKVKLAFRQYPLPFHPNAEKAAEATECAHEQGKFWAYHDILFQNQAAWENLPQAETSTTSTTTTQ
jgi:protein-disulfide isomerase